MHDMPEGREQAMCQLCASLHQVFIGDGHDHDHDDCCGDYVDDGDDDKG